MSLESRREHLCAFNAYFVSRTLLHPSLLWLDHVIFIGFYMISWRTIISSTRIWLSNRFWNVKKLLYVPWTHQQTIYIHPKNQPTDERNGFSVEHSSISYTFINTPIFHVIWYGYLHMYLVLFKRLINSFPPVSDGWGTLIALHYLIYFSFSYIYIWFFFGFNL